MLISVLTISYNHEKFISDCIESVFSQSGDFYEIEMIIIDDGSSDKTCDVVEKIIEEKGYRIKLIKDSHKGIFYLNSRLNYGIQLCSGKYISLISSDDGYFPNKFADHLSVLESDSKIVVCISPGVNIRNDNRRTFATDKKTKKSLLTNNPNSVLLHIKNNIPELYLQGMTFRGWFIKEKIKLNENILADDWQFNISIFQSIVDNNLSFCYFDSPVFYRNIHLGSTSLNLPIHHKRIRQMADLYSDSPRLMVFKFLLKSFFRAVRNRRYNDLHYIFMHFFKRLFSLG